MSHLTAPTSREAYRNLDASSQYKLIRSYLAQISPQSTCIADLAHALGIERSTASARLFELKNMGCLEYDGKRKSKRTGIKAMHWRIKSQSTLF